MCFLLFNSVLVISLYVSHSIFVHWTSKLVWVPKHYDNMEIIMITAGFHKCLSPSEHVYHVLPCHYCQMLF